MRNHGAFILNWEQRTHGATHGAYTSANVCGLQLHRRLDHGVPVHRDNELPEATLVKVERVRADVCLRVGSVDVETLGDLRANNVVPIGGVRYAR